LALASAAAGCRAHGGDLPQKPQEPAEGAGDDEGEGGGGAGTTGGQVSAPKAPEAGPKLMGYEYFVRASYGPETTKYNDTENNPLLERHGSLKGVGMTGHRYMIEHYPVVRENFPHSDYGYAALDLRDDQPNRDFWSRHQTMVLLAGYVLPIHRIITPVLGLHWEFNRMDMGKDDSPDIAKSDIRALVAGVDARQKIFGTGDFFATFYGLKLHVLNPAQKSTGVEAEANLGATLQLSVARLDFTAGYLEQRYDGEEPASDNRGKVGIQSRLQSTYMMVSLWL
jgi:hypothetical protein